MADFPATQTVHWASGPVDCCDEHARRLIAMGQLLGAHVVATTLTQPAQCSNCVNEAPKETDDA